MLENRIDREQEPVSLPPYGDHRRVPVEVVQCPISYLYKKTQTEETVPVCAVLAKYLVRRVKYRDGEWGGILGMSDGVVTHYFPDHNGKTTADSYIPCHEDLNWIIAQWKRVGIEFGGILRGNPPGETMPGESDLRYMAALLTFNPRLPSVLLGIVADGQLYLYRFDRDFLTWRQNREYSGQ